MYRSMLRSSNVLVILFASVLLLLVRNSAAFMPSNPSAFLPRSATVALSDRKPGVATDEEMDSFLKEFGVENIIVVDTRNPANEGGTEGAPVAGTVEGARPQAVSLRWDKENDRLTPFEGVLPEDKSTPIITHCTGGGRGQKGRLTLEEAGYTNVINGGGFLVPEHWEKFGSL